MDDKPKRRGVKPGSKRGEYKPKNKDWAGLGVRRKPGKKGGHLETTKHLLYFRPDKFKVRKNSSLGKALAFVVDSLLACFYGQAPPSAQLLAQRCAYKLIRAASYETYVLTGQGVPTLSADKDYITLAGSIRADIQALHMMAREPLPDDKLDLAKYIRLKECEPMEEAAQAVRVEPGETLQTYIKKIEREAQRKAARANPIEAEDDDA
jgi:hypothetical protein